MSWQPELDELRRREAMAAKGGGDDKTERQHAGGRLTVRERVASLVDDGTFHEIGAIAGKAEYDDDGQLINLMPSNNVIGRAEIDGRKVVIVGDDFTVRGGSADATIAEKYIMAEQMGAQLRLPIIRLIGGHRYVSGSKAALELIGQPMGGPRPPRLPLPVAELNEVKAALTSVGLFP